MTDFSNVLSLAVQDGDDKKVVQLVKEALAEGLPAMDILEKGLVPLNILPLCRIRSHLR